MASISNFKPEYFDLLYKQASPFPCVFSQETVKTVVFTDCNGGVEHAQQINRLAQHMFDQRFRDCVTQDGQIDKEQFSILFEGEILPEESDAFHVFDRSALSTWMQEQRSCPLCKKPIEVLLPCPYLTQKFGGRDVRYVQHPPSVERPQFEQAMTMAPSSVLQDPNELLKLFIIEMACFALKGKQPLDPKCDFRGGLISWCLLHDRQEAETLLSVIRRDAHIVKANLDLLKEHPMISALKNNMDAYVQSIGNIPEDEQVSGAHMQRFVELFLADHTNWFFMNALLSDTHRALQYTLVDRVMRPSNHRRRIIQALPLSDAEELESQGRMKRALVGCVVAICTLYMVGRHIWQRLRGYCSFRLSKTISES